MDKFELVTNPDSKRWVDVLRMAEQELGWKASKNDYNCYLQGYGRDGKFKGIFLVDPGTRDTIACVLGATVKTDTDEKLMTIGFFYVIKDLRGKGIGTELFEKLIGEEERQGTNLFLTSEPDLSAKYAARHHLSQFSWHINVIKAGIVDIDLQKFDVDESVKIRDMDHVAWDQVVAYDKFIQGNVNRGNFLKYFLGQEGAVSKFALNDMDTIIGYCTIRSAGIDEQDLLISPFYAQDKTVAGALLKATLTSFGENLASYDTIMLCPPKHNEDCIELMNKLTHERAPIVVSYPRQFSKHVIPAKEDKIYSIADYVLGHA